MIVGYQGVPGSYSEQALIQLFGNEKNTKYYKEFEDVFAALKNDEIDYGILPIENSTTGSIVQNYDLLKKYGYYITAETSVKVEHNLLGISGAAIDDITHIFSHPQGFEQSTIFLKRLPNVKHVAYHNTAIGAEYVKKEAKKTNAAIASKRAAELYNLEILESNIQNNKENWTRFIVVSKEAESNQFSNKMTILFEIPHKIGSLYHILEEFAKSKINMSKIESRPVGDGTFSYCFYIDIEGNKDDYNIKNAFENISEITKDFKILGFYNKNV
ncbi:prephenate dehydratase [Candidatus Epulonipiscium viviparus]|uniref:prephenate dehydratase n=1 Tax=Candidatus Epulonipiscium viviparus TaxID=420336 RepID=UPI0004970676|nr:prephenate dehydratase [Candidatus Epulopiscium viviparus]